MDKSDKSDKPLNECKKQTWTKTTDLKPTEVRCQEPKFRRSVHSHVCAWFMVYIVCIDDLIPYTSVLASVYTLIAISSILFPLPSYESYEQFLNTD